jgi:hypothetical protein
MKGMSMQNHRRKNYIKLLLDCDRLLWEDSNGMDTWECSWRADGMRHDVTVRYRDGSMVVLQRQSQETYTLIDRLLSFILHLSGKLQRQSQETCTLIGTDGRAHQCRTNDELLAACRQVGGLCGQGVISVLRQAGEMI